MGFGQQEGDAASQLLSDALEPRRGNSTVINFRDDENLDPKCGIRSAGGFLDSLDTRILCDLGLRVLSRGLDCYDVMSASNSLEG